MADIKLDIEKLTDVKVYSISYGANLPMSGLEANAAAARLMFTSITMSIELTDSTAFFEWITTKKKISGTIKVENFNEPGDNLRKIVFEDAYISHYGEAFNDDGGGANVSIVFTKIDFNGIKYNIKAGK